MTALAPLMFLLPLIAAGLNLILGRYKRIQVLISTFTLLAALVVSVLLLIYVDNSVTVVVQIGGWDAPIGITLVVDRLSASMLVISALVLLSVLVYSIGQGIADGDRETPISIFHPTYLILSAGLFNAFMAGDLFNLYVAFEVLLASSYVLLTLRGTGARIRAGVTYIVVSIISSVFFLAAIAMIYGATGTLNIAQIGERIAELSSEIQLMLNLVLLIGFGVKAALYPMSYWLPDSYPTAPAPITAVFAGLLTKVGVYAIIRTQTVMFDGTMLAIPLMIIGGLTMIFGILGAVAQADIKRLLSFTLVSHIGYMIFGISLASVAGYTATVYYVAHHILVQTALFLATGLVERLGGTTSITRLGGLLAASPVVAMLFFLPALNLGGIPPFSGFLGKAGLFIAGAETPSIIIWVVITLGALTSLLTLYALTRVWNMAFWRKQEEVSDYESPLLEMLVEAPEDDGEVNTKAIPRLMVTATTFLVAVTIALTVFAGPLFNLANRIGVDISDSSNYIGAVNSSGGGQAE